MGLPMGSLLSHDCPLHLLWGSPCNRKPNHYFRGFQASVPHAQYQRSQAAMMTETLYP